jgi:DNA-binding transcriptional regulator YiaG
VLYLLQDQPAAADRTENDPRAFLSSRRGSIQHPSFGRTPMPPSAYTLSELPTVRARRDQIAFSQAELATATGISASTLRRLERGRRS